MAKLPDLWRNDSFPRFERDPFREISHLQRQMDRLFRDFFSSNDSWSSPALSTNLSGSFNPICDISEKNRHFVLSFDLPGVKEEDILIEIHDDHLVVSGERKEEHEDKERKYSERFYGTFSRSFSLPSGIKPEEIEADYSNGVLRVTLPKSETSRSWQIPIGKGKTGEIPSGLSGVRDERTSKEDSSNKERKAV